MKRFNVKALLLGLLCAVMVVALGIPAFAAALQAKNITVYTGISMCIDDKAFVPKDANGNVIEAMAYNGTTYLPIRAVSEALGKNVYWDSAEKCVYIGKHSTEKPVVMLQDLTYFVGSDMYETVESTDNLGNKHYRALGRKPYDYSSYCSFKNTYLINGQYSKIAGTVYQNFYWRSDTTQSTLRIYGDGELLKVVNVAGGILPVEYEVDLTGVLELVVEWSSPRARDEDGDWGYPGRFTCGLYS